MKRLAERITAVFMLCILLLPGVAAAIQTGSTNPSVASGVSVSWNIGGVTAYNVGGMNGLIGAGGSSSTNYWTDPYGGTINGAPSLYMLIPNPTARTATITFSQPVDNPVLHIERLGGFGANGRSNSSIWTLTGSSATSPVTFTKLSGNSVLSVTTNSFQRSPVGNAVNRTSDCLNSDLGTACGSIQVSGYNITSLTFDIVIQGDLVDANDGFEAVWTFAPAKVRVEKQTIGGTGAFGFTGTNGFPTTAVNISTATTNPNQSSYYDVMTNNGAISITESTSPSTHQLTAVTCSSLKDASTTPVAITSTPNLATRTVTVAAADYAPGDQITCQFVNSRLPTVKVAKNSIGGTGAFGFTLTGVTPTTDSITTTTAGTTVTSATVHTGNFNTAASLAETSGMANYDTTYSCIDANAAFTGNNAAITGSSAAVSLGATAQIPSANMKAGADYTCTFTNTKRATLRIGKKRVGTQGGPVVFNFSGTGPRMDTFSMNLSTSERWVRDYGTQTAPYSASGALTTTPLWNLVSGTYGVTESFTDGNNNDFELTSVSCLDLNDTASGVNSVPGSSVTGITYGANGGSANINLVPGANYYCEYVNTQKPLLVVTKQVQGPGATFNYTVTATGTGTLPAPFSLTPPTNDNTQTNLTVNVNSGPRDVTVTETTPPTGYVLVSSSCTKIRKAADGTQTSTLYPLGGTPVNGASVTILDFTTSDTANCTFVNALKPTVTIRKETLGGTGAFAFGSGTNGLPASGLTLTTTSATPTGGQSSTAYALTTPNAAASIKETIPAGWTLADIACTSSGNSVSVTKDLATGTLTIPASLTTGGAVLSCTFINAKRPTIQVKKNLSGAATSFTFNYTGATNSSNASSETLSVPANGSVTGALFSGTAGTAATVTETYSGSATYDTSYSCVDANAASTGNTTQSGNGTQVSLSPSNMVAGAAWTCTFTNAQRATVQIVKVSSGATGLFRFNGTNGVLDQQITTTALGNPGTSGTIQTLTQNNTITRVSEYQLPAGFSLDSVSCTGLGAGGTATPTVNGTAGGYVDLDEAATAAGSNIVCTFRNSRLANVSFRKAKIGNDTTAVTASFVDTANSNLSSTPGSVTSATADGTPGAADSPISVLQAGTDVLATEAPITGYYLSSAQCIDTNSTVSGNTAAPFAATTTPAGGITIPATYIKSGATLVCTLTNTKQGSIQIIKDTVPDTTDAFAFTTTGSGLSGFTLDDDGNTANTYSNTITFNNLAPGATYTVAETANAAYTLLSLVCTGDITGGTNTASTTAGNTATIKLDPGENIVCTFTNTKKPTLTVAKISNGGIDSFAFTGSNGYPGETIATTTSGQEKAGTKVTLTTVGATTTITEIAPPAGWTLSGATCTGIPAGSATFDAATRTVTLNSAATAAGNDIKCVFTNTKAAKLTIAKISNGTTGTFKYDVSGGATPSTVTIQTTQAGQVTSSVLTSVPTGTNITVTELTPTAPPVAPEKSTYLTDVNCVNAAGSAPGSSLGAPSITNGSTELGHRTVNLVSGADVICTFTNSVEGTLTITKQTVGQSGTFNYTFTNAPSGTSPSAPSITTDATTNLGQVEVTVPHTASVTYDLTEAVNPNFQLTRITCNSGNTSAPATFVTDVPNNKVTITSQPGAVKDCRFVNVHKPNITIKKSTVGGTGAFKLSGGTNGLEAANNVELNTATANPATSPTTYKITDVTKPASITETIPAGENWTSTWECVNTENAVNASGTGTTITLDATKMTANGLDITCTFTNTKSPKLTVVKQVVGAANVAFDINVSGGGLATAQDAVLTPTTDGGTAQQVITGLAPNTNITLSEAQTGYPTGWTLSSMVCVNNNTTTGSTLVGATEVLNANRIGGSITGQLVPGADVTCTFKNTRNVTGNLKKTAIGGDSTFVYDVYFNATTPGTTPDLANLNITTTNGTGTFTGQFPSSGTGTFVIKEQPKTGWTLTSITCAKDAASTGTYSTTETNIAGRYIAGTVTAGTVVNCEFTNIRTPVITLGKKTIGGTGTFTLGSGTNGLPTAPLSITTAAAGTAVNATTTYPIADINAIATVTETVPAGWTLTGVECRNATGVVTSTLSGSQLTIPVATLQQGQDLTCVFTNTKDTKLTLAKKTGGGYGSFPIDVNIGGTASTETLATNADGATASVVIPDVPSNTTITLSELSASFPADWSFASATCVDNLNGTTGSSLVSATGTPNAGRKGGSISGQLVTGADVTCTFYNTKNVTGKVVKTTVGGDGSFSYNAYLNVTSPTAANLGGNYPLTTSGGTGTVSATFPQVASGSFVIEEVAPTGWTLDSISCSQDAGSPGTLTNVSTDVANRYVTGTVGPGTRFTCDFKNIRKPLVKITKVTSGGVGSFDYTMTGLGTNTSATVTTTAPTNSATSAGFEVADINGTVTIAETAQSDWTLASATCVDSTGAAVNAAQSGGTLTIGSTELRKGLDITCTYTNKKKASLQLVKTIRNDNGGTAVVSAFNLATNAGAVNFGAGTVAANDTTYSSNVLSIAAGTYSLTESAVANYDNGTWSCVVNGAAGAAAGAYNAGSITLADGDVAVCSILNNDTNKADVFVSKTDGLVEVVSGTTTTYTVRVNNRGPASASGAVLTDTPQAGLTDCKIVSCTTTGGAGTCPANGTAVPESGYSYTISTLPAISTMTLGVECKVK